jgi:hypothetical protein
VTAWEPLGGARRPSGCSFCMLVEAHLELVFRDRLGRYLVGLNVRRDTALRVLGLTCLIRGLVR